METQAIDRGWVKSCFVTDCVTGERMTIDEGVRKLVDNDHICASLRELARRGVELQRSITSRPADPEKLARWAADVVRKSNYSPEWLAIGDEPGAAVSRAELMAILHRIALEEAEAAVALEARRLSAARVSRRYAPASVG